MRRILLAGLFLWLFNGIVVVGVSQVITNVPVLQKAAQLRAAKEKEDFSRLLVLAKDRNWPLVKHGLNGRRMQLVGINNSGFPKYLSTQNNIVSAATIGTSSLWPGGSTGLNLSGSSANMKGRLAVWDGGGVLNTHVELVGRILQKDSPAKFDDHSTHVSGTMMASGVKPEAKGMAFGLQQLIAYDYNNDNSEMLGEAVNLLASNHSYAYNAGWVYNSDDKRWEFWGEPGATEDYKFGYYDDDTQLWDSIAYNAPNYLIVKAGGNSRLEIGPKVGETYWRMNDRGTFVNAGPRPANISSNDGYDIITTTSGAKNILTVGAVNPITAGYAKPADVVMSGFSAWGPTDDGRIKPDVVADGVDVTSCIASSSTAYATYSGTSMASPAVAGSVMLLQELYSQKHSGALLRAATIKGLVIHTADEAGAGDGPDYQFGWGLVDMQKAAAVIVSNNTDQLIYEKVLANGKSDTIKVVASGKGKLMATISWTDPKGNVDETNVLNNHTKKLVNDLDLRIKTGTTVYMPWVLDPANPANAATLGDNITDNVERVEVNNATPGDTSLVIVKHKGTLARGAQAYSLIISGVGGGTTCTSGATSSAGTRIENVTIGNINTSNTTSCATYTDNKNLSLNIEANQALPFSITTSSCDATNATRFVKIFIDYNNDGDFDDAGEMVAQSGALNNGTIFSGTIQTPGTIVTGNSFAMRIVAMETASADNVKPCGTYPNGETQDYLVKVVASTNDMGVIAITAPITGLCANTAQYITVDIKNFGGSAKSSVPLTVTVKNGNTTVATINETYPGSIESNSDVIYTFQTPFTSVSGTTYTITARTNLTPDQTPSNDATTATVVVAGKSANPTGRALICGTDNISLIADTAVGNDDVFNWYSSVTSAIPLATGSFVTTNALPASKSYFVAKNDTKLSIGPADKNTLGVGGYKEGLNYITYSSTVPLVLETVKLYVGHAGQVAFDIIDDTSTQTILASTTIDVYATQNGDVDNGAVFNVNLVLPAGNHFIYIDGTSGATLFRNNGVTTNPYPFTIPGVFAITSNSAAISDNFQLYYYYLYDIKLRFINCASDRAEIVAGNVSTNAPVITLLAKQLTSSLPNGNQWMLDGTPIPGATDQTYNPTANGTYKVVNTSPAGCVLSSNEIYISNGAAVQQAMAILPNLNNGKFDLKFSEKVSGNMTVVLYNSIGQKVFYNEYANVAETDKITNINTGNFASGVYILRVQIGGKIYSGKMVIDKFGTQ